MLIVVNHELRFAGDITSSVEAHKGQAPTADDGNVETPEKDESSESTD